MAQLTPEDLHRTGASPAENSARPQAQAPSRFCLFFLPGRCRCHTPFEERVCFGAIVAAVRSSLGSTATVLSCRQQPREKSRLGHTGQAAAGQRQLTACLDFAGEAAQVPQVEALQVSFVQQELVNLILWRRFREQGGQGRPKSHRASGQKRPRGGHREHPAATGFQQLASVCAEASTTNAHTPPSPPPFPFSTRVDARLGLTGSVLCVWQPSGTCCPWPAVAPISLLCSLVRRPFGGGGGGGGGQRACGVAACALHPHKKGDGMRNGATARRLRAIAVRPVRAHLYCETRALGKGVGEAKGER
jgi:hypothetical protein